MSDELTLAPACVEDLAEVLVLNEANVPEVGPTDLGRLGRFLDMATLFLVARHDDGRLAGFVIVLGEGCDYDSPNYRWFADRHERFTYVDRVVVAATARRRGLARRLYDEVVAHAVAARSPHLFAEVNVQPRNDVSLAFHERYGFNLLAEVDDPRYAELRVAMLALDLPAAGAGA